MVTIEKISRIYGVTPRTVVEWCKRGCRPSDFLDPATIAQKLAATAKNRSPKLEALLSPKNQGLIHFRLAVAGLITPNKK